MFSEIRLHLIEVVDQPKYKYKYLLPRDVSLAHFKTLVRLCHCWYNGTGYTIGHGQGPRKSEEFESPIKESNNNNNKTKRVLSLSTAQQFTRLGASRAVRQLLKSHTILSSADLVPLVTASLLLGLPSSQRDALCIEAARRMEEEQVQPPATLPTVRS
jgi:hypothetical protein